MRKLLLGNLITAIIISIFIDTGFTFQNEPDGFRKLKWGDPPARNMIFLGKENNGLIGIYKVSVEKLHLGEVKLEMILYMFYGRPRKFMIVALYFKEIENFKLLRDLCQTKFGKSTNIGFFELEWKGQTGSVFLNYRLIDDDGKLMLANTALLAEYNEKVKEKEAKKAKKDW